MSNELISVIVPVYNTEKYLGKCLDSIISQSHTELEIIIVDDGSTDSCPDICEAYARKDSRISVYRRENSGISASRSFGLEMCRGSLVAFADSDDYLAPDMLEKLYRRIKEDCSDISVCEYTMVSENGVASPFQPRPLPVGLMSGEEAIYLLGGDKGHQLVPMWNKLYRREILDGLTFPGRMCCEDEMLIHRILYRSSKVSLLNDRLYYYLQREGSITSAIDDCYLLDAASAFLARCCFLREKGLYAPAFRAASGAVNLLYVSDTRPENRVRERELSRELKDAVRTLKSSEQDLRMRLKLFLLPDGKFIYKALRRLKAALKRSTGK